MILRYLFIIFFNSVIFCQGWFSDENWKESLYSNYSPAVVIVYALDNNDNVLSNGSGFNVNESGSIVTNYHVIKEAPKVKVEFKNGDRFDVLEYNFVDKDKDFAILKIAGFNLPTINLGNSDNVKIGQEVVAIGNPSGQWHSMTMGIISQRRQFPGMEMLQTDVTIAPGSSGGPLFNEEKEVIGITSGGLGQGLDINLAIPSNYVLGAIKAGFRLTRKNVGFDIKKITYSNKTPKTKTPPTTNRPQTAQEKYEKEQSDDTIFLLTGCGCVAYVAWLIFWGLLPPA